MGRLFEIEGDHVETNANANNKNKTTPLLMLLGELHGETKQGFFGPANPDPVKQLILTEVEFPELHCQVECLSSGFGWLLLVSRETSSIFFFNPFTRQKIHLPYRSSVFTAATFTAPPTSSDCIVYAIQHLYGICVGNYHVDVLRVGQEKVWTRYIYKIGMRFGVLMQAVCIDGILYCIDSCGRVATFDSHNGDWTTISGNNFQHVRRLSCFFKLNSELFGVKLSGNYSAVQTIYKLKLENGVAAAWEEVKDMRDLTLFLDPWGSSFAVQGLDEELHKKIFLAREDPKSKCLIYDSRKGDYKKSGKFDASPYSWWYKPIWVERTT